MSDFVPFVLFMIVMSIVAERLADIVKRAFRRFAETQDGQEPRYPWAAVLRLIVVGLIGVLAWSVNPQFIAALPPELRNLNLNWTAYLMIGLLASGGSAVWRDFLTTVKATADRFASKAKVAKEDALARLTIAQAEVDKAEAQKKEAEIRLQIAQAELKALAARV